MTSETESTNCPEPVREHVLANAFAGASSVVLTGEEDEVAQLVAAMPPGFVALEQLSDQPSPEPCEVLALGVGHETLERAVETARRVGSKGVCVLVEGQTAAGVLDRLRAGGLAVAESERLLWRLPPNGAGAGSRDERLDDETEAVLLRCVLVDDPESVARLEDEVARLRAELDVRAQLEVDHAATREVERARADRLRELEASFERFGGVALVPEVERLQGELEAMRTTRIWRFGIAWWRLRDRILRR